MEHEFFIFEIVGDAFGGVGVFLLSVEAIKLQNLYKLRDRFLLPMEHTLEAGTFQPQKTEWTFDELRTEHVALRHFFISHYGTGLAMLVVAALIALRASTTISSFFWSLSANRARMIITTSIVVLLLLPLAVALFTTRHRSRVVPMAVMVATVLASFPVGLVPMGIGEIGHQGSMFVVRKTLHLLELIAKGTPTGTIGILGFLAVFVGKVIQLLASHAP